MIHCEDGEGVERQLDDFVRDGVRSGQVELDDEAIAAQVAFLIHKLQGGGGIWSFGLPIDLWKIDKLRIQ